ncbi:NtaA/DmoA family FMN-dependent monooxygenase [Microbacterium trichothecenolyticum]|uniref:FMN-dependent oxidoreductase (Nitrilotriacetate monooxygenase family) n=1 Tax=Microbacterium trichothecenolyticum TaxID=69370 RepID=A0ABU0TZ37_MICTR|nr:NtaA/DmoA family FMN-dependent monooxygenase [Microbacterium trichothecenolyticum]MDQ1124925.1 FMN-dependent oxidoreductase (nitrilotriacetate monooxygenase family) [Microbacterium trichothecenolyticum]
MTSDSEKKPLILNLFEMSTVSHISHGLWSLPENNRHRFGEIGFWTELAQLLEEGDFDGVFLADVVGAYDTFRGGPETAVREGLQIPSHDPLLVIPSMASATTHLGFGVTFSTSYEPPFSFARRMSTLDHLTGGRVGWNIVTSYLPNAARNFGLAEEIPHDTRYEIADEFLEVVYKLWEGSWDDDAVLADRDRGVYTDPAKVRYIDHAGEHFRVAGPHLVEPSPQRTPVLYQATQSEAGIAFAGRHAELVFTGGRTADDFRRHAGAMRAAAVANGRGADDLRFIVQAGVITGRTEKEAADKWQRYRERRSLDAILAHASAPLDLPNLPREQTIRAALADAGLSAKAMGPIDPETTVGATLDRFAQQREGRFFVAGTPTVVADEIERWLDEDGVDGINLRQYHSFDTARDFVELVVPELRRRGRIRERPASAQTLRERLFGNGPRLSAPHPVDSYRGARGVRLHRPPLRFGAR